MAEDVSRLPFELDPLIAEAKRRMRRRRSLAALLIALAGLAVGLPLAWRSPAAGPGAPRLHTSSLRAGKLKVSVPQGFHGYAVGDVIARRLRVTGQVVTDDGLPAGADAFDVWGYWSGVSGPPATGVALGVRLAEGWGRYPREYLHLPLTLDQAGWFEQRLNDGVASYRYGFIRFHKEHYLVNYWSGPAAPARDRAAILRAL